MLRRGFHAPNSEGGADSCRMCHASNAHHECRCGLVSNTKASYQAMVWPLLMVCSATAEAEELALMRACLCSLRSSYIHYQVSGMQCTVYSLPLMQCMYRYTWLQLCIALPPFAHCMPVSAIICLVTLAMGLCIQQSIL